MKWRHVRQWNESWFEVNDKKLTKDEFKAMLEWMLKLAVADDKKRIIGILKKVEKYTNNV